MLKNKLFSLQLDGKSSLRDSCTGPKNKAGGNGSAGAGWDLGLSSLRTRVLYRQQVGWFLTFTI